MRATTRDIQWQMRDSEQNVERNGIDTAQDVIADALRKAGRGDLVHFFYDIVYEAMLTSYNVTYNEHRPGELAFELAQTRSRLKMRLAQLGENHELFSFTLRKN